MSAEPDQLLRRIEELRDLPLAIRERLELPVPHTAVWELLGEPRRLPDLLPSASVALLPNGYQVDYYGGRSRETVQTEVEVSGLGAVRTHNSGTLFGLALPTPEWQGSWVLVEPTPSGGTTAELGHAYRFKNRIAQQAGRALLPLQQKVIKQMADNTCSD